MLCQSRRSSFYGHRTGPGAERQTLGLIDELRSGAQKATAHARVSVREAELGHDLSEAYAELGRETFGLMQAGAVRQRSLAPLAKRVGELEASLGALRTEEEGAHTA